MKTPSQSGLSITGVNKHAKLHDSTHLLNVTRVLVNFLHRPIELSNLFGASARNLSERKRINAITKRTCEHQNVHEGEGERESEQSMDEHTEEHRKDFTFFKGK